MARDERNGVAQWQVMFKRKKTPASGWRPSICAAFSKARFGMTAISRQHAQLNQWRFHCQGFLTSTNGNGITVAGIGTTQSCRRQGDPARADKLRIPNADDNPMVRPGAMATGVAHHRMMKDRAQPPPRAAENWRLKKINHGREVPNRSGSSTDSVV